MTGVVNGDNIIATYTTTATQTSAPGTYPITAALNDPGQKLANYTVTNTAGTLTITSNSQTITFPAIAATVPYGAAPATLSATASSGLPITYILTGPAALGGSTLAFTGAGTVTITASQAGNQYYSAATSVVQTVVVAKANLIVMANSYTRVYSAANPALTGTVTGIVNGDSITATYSTSATQTSPIGTYPITATLADPNNRLGNYNVTNTAGTLTITASATTVVLTASATTLPAGSPVTFNATLSANGVAFTGGTVTFLNGSTLLGTATVGNGGATLTLGTLSAGSYSVTASYAASGNFAAGTSNAVALSVVTPVSSSLNPASLTLKASGSASSTLTITPAAGFTGQVTVSCSSPVAYINCTASAPAAIVGTAPVTSTVSINVAATASLTAPHLMPVRLDQTITYALLPLGALLLLPVLTRRKKLLQFKSIRLLTLALFALITTAAMTGCGGSNSFNTDHSVPTGTTNVTLTVTANGVTSTTTLAVTITS